MSQTSCVALCVRLTVKPERADAFAAGLAQAAPSTHAAPGNLGFSAGRSREQPAVFVLYERWASQADFDAWHGSPMMRERMASYPELLQGPPEVTMLEDLA